MPDSSVDSCATVTGSLTEGRGASLAAHTATEDFAMPDPGLDSLPETQSLMVAQREPLAPIHRLPFELLGKIISFCALRPSAVPKDVLVLATVSRTWRDTTLNTPRLWSNIALTCDDDYDEPDRLPLNVARVWFARAAACAKDVYIDGEAITPGTHQLCEILDLIEPHTATLRTLSLGLYCADRAARTQLLSVLAQPMPTLQYLILKRGCLEPGIRDMIDYTNKPRLRAVHTSDLDVAWYPLPCQMQLRRLTLESPRLGTPGTRPISQVLSTLHSHGVLSGLRALLVISQFEGNDPYEGAVHAGELEILALEGPIAPTRFFQWLSAPKLTTLVIRTGYFARKPHQAMECVRALARAAPPLLRELYLDGLEAHDASFAALFVRLPHLETFVLHRAQLTGALLGALSSPDYSHGKKHVGWLCPRLARLSIAGGRGNKNRVSSEAMEAFVEARLRGHLQAADSVAEVVAVRHNGSALAAFGHDAPRESWSWVYGGGHMFMNSDWWTSFAEELHF
ncbi:hypothetical protein AURDEDRAFT_184188 [Auricularia subglabra TFB-10046 SS5]|nr:hypothetical protein AURDEDRAFT_184188 [Auricularia subglabra TFB-10046 SS5]